MDDDKTLAGCVAGGRDLRLGTGSILVLERRLTRQLVADLHVHGAVREQDREAPVGSPLVIVGPPRSGTTLLLELLACDGDTWRQLAAPDATTPCAVSGPSARAVAGLTEAAGRPAVHVRQDEAHPLRALGRPDGCRTALENGAARLVLWWVFGLTDRLDAWMDDEADRDRDYAFYKAQLGVALPDAKVVCLHREPVAVATSLCSLLANVWKVVHRVDAPESGKSPFGFESKIVEYLGRMVDASLDFRKKAPDADIHDLKMTDLVADPIANVREIRARARTSAARPPPRTTMSAEEQAQALQQLRSQVNEQAQRELMTKMTEKCFAKCATGKGSGQLDRNEQMCLANCIDRYVDCMSSAYRAARRAVA
ncbi:hypothetical protein JL720_7221 [Aureococcus anophagefferens]|nr:hypothetical protein JL720_7221 [Aureococcus anophagefferens]